MPCTSPRQQQRRTWAHMHAPATAFPCLHMPLRHKPPPPTPQRPTPAHPWSRPPPRPPRARTPSARRRPAPAAPAPPATATHPPPGGTCTSAQGVGWGGWVGGGDGTMWAAAAQGLRRQQHSTAQHSTVLHSTALCCTARGFVLPAAAAVARICAVFGSGARTSLSGLMRSRGARSPLLA